MSLDILQINAQLAHLASVAWQKYSGPDGLSLLLLLGTIVLAAGITFWQQGEVRRSVRAFIQYAFPISVLRHPSARADALFWICRRLTAPFMAFPFVLTAAATGFAVNAALMHVTGLSSHATTGLSPGLLVLFMITMLIAYDLSYYIYHVLQHNLPFMWELHKVHHSAEVMVGITSTRVHPLDQLMNKVWDGFIPGIAYGIWMFFVLDPIEALVFGINVYVLRNILMMDVVRHTHYPFSFGVALDRVMLSPHAHQLHHSVAPIHYNKNYGLMLSVWDRMFGTMIDPKVGETFEFGLGGTESREYHSLFGLYILPVIKVTRMCRGALLKMYELATSHAPSRHRTVRHE
jgi:sterol desaturase/sphingolipid hydroxylase (fatty acid hydroxylase superfamily)